MISLVSERKNNMQIMQAVDYAIRDAGRQDSTLSETSQTIAIPSDVW